MQKFQIKSSTFPLQYFMPDRHYDHRPDETTALTNFCGHCGTQLMRQRDGATDPDQITKRTVRNSITDNSNVRKPDHSADNDNPLRSMVAAYPRSKYHINIDKVEISEAVGWISSIFISSSLFFSLILWCNISEPDLWTWLIMLLYIWSPLFLVTGLILNWMLNKVFRIDRPQQKGTPSAYWALIDLLR